MKIIHKNTFLAGIIALGLGYLPSQNKSALKENVIYGCTTFTIIAGSKTIFGRNLDVDNDLGNVFINPPNVKKVAYFSKKSQEIPATWISKYGSVTFNQISKDIPHGGMNREGLVVEHLFLEESKYEPKDTRPALISHQWVQYMLDNCKTVKEIIVLSSKIRISETDYKFPIHFHIMDRNGDRAIFEFLNGKMLVYTNETYEVGVLANSTYKNSLNQYESTNNNDGENPLPTDISNSLERFMKAAEMVRDYNNEDIIPYGFSILDTVRNGTQWQIVYDIENLQIYYRTESLKKIRILKLKDLDFNNTREIKTISVNAYPDVEDNWQIYNTNLNRELINAICNKSEFINSILGEEKEEIAVY